MEILIGGLIFVCTIYIIIKSVKKLTKGKCISGCEGCSRKNQCTK